MSEEVNFIWTDIEQNALDGIKIIVASNNLLEYLSFNEIFYMHEYERNIQLVVVINKRIKTFMLYIQKLDDPQVWYMAIGKKLIGIPESLKHF